MAREELKRHWALSETAFAGLLAWLDEGADSQGARYLEMRRRLVSYFERKQCPGAEELADETLNRVARRLEEEGSIREATPAHFCYLTARFVFLESLRSGERGERSLEGLAPGREWESRLAVSPDAPLGSGDTLLACLDKCLETLPPAEREWILEYYQGERGEKIERRRQLATRLGVTMNALAIRAARIRNRLERCVADCAASRFPE